MALLIIGLALWCGVHWLKRLTPGVRAALNDRLGDASRGIIAAALVLAIVLMVIGYRAAEFLPVYAPMPGMGHLNNLLMLFSVYFFGIGAAKGILASKIRHPMLWGTVIWAVAHLLVNGDVASLVLFGGIGAWALISMGLINRGVGPWERPAPGPLAKDLKTVVITLVLFGIIAGVHLWLGRSPFLGTYG